MAEVSIKYHGVEKGTLNATGTKTIKTAGKYCDADIVVDYTRPGAETQSKTVTPSESEQEVTPDAGKMLEKVTVNPISSTYVGTGVTRKAAATYTPGTTNQTIAANQYLTGAQTIIGSANLIASNIKSGVNIFGITGSLLPGITPSGTLNITQNGTYNVTNYASVYINVGGTPSVPIGCSHIGKTVPSGGSTSIIFDDFLGIPVAYFLTARHDMSASASPYGITAMMWDGSTTNTQYLTTTSNSQVSHTTALSATFTNDQLWFDFASEGYKFTEGTYDLYYLYGGSASDLKTATFTAGSGTTSASFTVEGEPRYWFCIFTGSFGTSSGYARCMYTFEDWEHDVCGMYMNSKANSSYQSWSKSYSNGTFTISSTSNSNGGFFHQPGSYKLLYIV